MSRHRRGAGPALLLALACAGAPAAARAADPVDAPVVRRPGESAPPAVPPPVTRSLPEWLEEAIGLSPPLPPGEPPPPRDAPWSLLPFVVANPLMGVGGGAAVVGAFRLGPARTTSFSSFAGSAIVTSNHQYGASLRTDLRLPRNDWILVGDWGWSRFPNPAWGLGGDSPESDKTIVDRKELRLHESGFRQVAPQLYLGAGWFLDLHYDIRDRRAAAGETTAFSSYGIGTAGRSISSGLAWSILSDRRDDPIYPTSGTYALLRYRASPRGLGSSTSWHSLYLDLRAYLPIASRPDVLAVWAFGWVTSRDTPYLLLPAIGADPEHRSGRGYVEARHVGKDLLGVEVEYRFHLWEWLGGVVGGNLHAVTEQPELSGQGAVREWSPAFVAGLRLLLDRTSRSNVTLDVALAPGGRVAVYVNANEAF